MYPFLEMKGGFGNGTDGDEVLEQSKHLSLGLCDSWEGNIKKYALLTKI